MSEPMLLSLVAAANAWMLAMSIRSWQYGKEKFDRLPDRVPVHFGLSGKPDRYAKKSRFSVFWAPVLCVCMQIFMTGLFLMIYREEGPDAALFLAAGTGLTFSLCWLLLRAQLLIINVALGQESNAWPRLAAPLALMIASSALFAALPFYLMSLPAEYTGAVFCESLDRDMNPVRAGESFSQDTQTVFILTRWKNLNGRVSLEYRWFNPDGGLAHTGRFEKKYDHIKSRRNMWYRLDLRHFREQGMRVTGEWRVEVFRNGRRAATERFRVTEQP